MKRPKKPTLAQKKLISGAGLRWTNWMVQMEDDSVLKLINKITGKTRDIKKK